MKQARLIGLPIVFCLLIGTGCRPFDSTSTPARSPTNALTQWAQTRTSLPPDTEIIIKRTGCFGTCPIYTAHMSADGHVQFDGENFVAHKGTHTTQIPVTRMHQLVEQFAALNFFALRDQYGTMGDCPRYTTDQPSVIISLHFAATTKTVELYLGCSGSAEAQAVVQLGKQIDATINSQQWIK
jgi:hypothetical protein